jgi:hypothetical protein
MMGRLNVIGELRIAGVLGEQSQHPGTGCHCFRLQSGNRTTIPGYQHGLAMLDPVEHGGKTS